ncbi:hypothetical protein KJ359_001831 [Pestalotiopsis sp. 9143b]|nr:hypothetical protein KJ359_001831 [Pestalotiopsis sp. 9143b]
MGGIGSFIQSCKTYLPSLGNVQAFAVALSRVDPHGIAPLVVTSVFFVIQLILNTLYPNLRERTLTLLSKTSTMMNKWILYEVAQATRISAYKSKHSKELAETLPSLYLKAFEAISLILQVLMTKIPSALVQGRVPSIERSLSELERFDRACEENPEPSHTTVVFRTGLDKPDSQAALWLLNTSRFKSWVDGLSSEKSERVLWLEGIMGSGRTSLICRLISYLEQYPINKTRVVFYYCYGSATGNQNSGPGY